MDPLLSAIQWPDKCWFKKNNFNKFFKKKPTTTTYTLPSHPFWRFCFVRLLLLSFVSIVVICWTLVTFSICLFKSSKFACLACLFEWLFCEFNNHHQLIIEKEDGYRTFRKIRMVLQNVQLLVYYQSPLSNMAMFSINIVAFYS